jgi:hypothetical protein
LRPSTLRAKFGKTKVQNAVHCTDLPEDGLLEVILKYVLVMLSVNTTKMFFQSINITEYKYYVLGHYPSSRLCLKCRPVYVSKHNIS